MDQPTVENESEFEVHPQLLLHASGERLALIAKATFLLTEASQLVLAPPEMMRPIRLADEPWGEPEVDSIRYPSDLYLEKAGTDVVFVGTAHPPPGQQTESFDAYLRVGGLAKAIRVFGVRVWEAGGQVSRARPALPLDVRYDFAWGGRDLSDPGSPREEPRNPVGLGVRANTRELVHQLAPQIEDADSPIRSFSAKAVPASLGAVGRSFAPRRDYLGTYDEQWKMWVAPLPPSDQEPRHFNFASPGLTALPPLVGGEECALLNLSNPSPLRFVLPRIALRIGFYVKGRNPEVFCPAVDTLLIDTWATGPEKPAAIEMTWRAHVKAPRRQSDARIVIVEALNEPA